MRATTGFNKTAMIEYIRQSIPFGGSQKVNQEYGVKMLALKNLRQILRYA